LTDKLEHVKRIFDFSYCPIVYTEQNKECEIIWQIAKQKTEQKYPDFTAHSWRIGENEKPVLVYSLDNYHDSIIYFWNQLKESANNKIVEVPFNEVIEALGSIPDSDDE